MGSMDIFKKKAAVPPEKEEKKWGDSGVCGFFCTPAELKERNFSNVLYNWDCY